MPEILEVEGLADTLRRNWTGAKLLSLGKRTGFSKTPLGDFDSLKQFWRQVKGSTVLEVLRYGKNLVFRLGVPASPTELFQQQMFWHIHMGSTGWVREAGTPSWSRNFIHSTGPKTIRYLMDLFDSVNGVRHYEFTDARLTMTWELGIPQDEFQDPRSLFKSTAHLGPDWLSDPSAAADRLRKYAQSGNILTVLTDQKIACGIGLYLANEISWMAKVHPSSKWQSASPQLRGRIIDSVQLALLKFRDHEGWSVFRRRGLPCLRCNTTIEREEVSGRGVYFCSQCQARY